jgi:heptosyltransferase I
MTHDILLMKIFNSGRLPKKILIVKPSSLGDVVHSLPFLNAIKSCFPKAEIHWVIAKGLEGLFEGHPMINRLVIINKDSWNKVSKGSETIMEIARLFKELKNERYDMVVDLQGLLRSGIITMSTQAPLKIGFAEAREGSSFFYHYRIRTGKDIHAVDRYMKIAEALGCDTGSIFFPFFPPKVREHIREIFSSSGQYAVIVPGARWDTKIWPAERFGKLASMLPMKSVVIGGVADIQIADTVVAYSQGKAITLAGMTTLGELIAIMRDARMVISNDSGPMHIAAAFNVPVVALFGPTSPSRTGPYGKGHCIIRSAIPCSPCYKKRCDDLKCMEEITVVNVFKKMDNLIALS